MSDDPDDMDLRKMTFRPLLVAEPAEMTVRACCYVPDGGPSSEAVTIIPFVRNDWRLLEQPKGLPAVAIR